MTVLPMFPLGSVLLPSVVLPLQVFEPRYRALASDCLEGGREFGVVLIERGSEVGGGDVRTDVGTVARIIEAAALPDGRLALGTVGVRRIRVLSWLDDDPYPRAEVEDWPDPDPVGDLDVDEVVALLRRVLAQHTELGDVVADATAEVADDPVLAGYQVLALSPLGAADRQRLLAARSPEERTEGLRTALTEQLEVLDARMRLEGPGPDAGDLGDLG